MASFDSSVHTRKQLDDHDRKGSIEQISATQSDAHDDDDFNDYYAKYPNRWSRIRYTLSSTTPDHCSSCSAPFFLLSEWIREPAAEFFGVMILIIFGNGVDCQTVLGANPNVSAGPKGVCIFNVGNVLVHCSCSCAGLPFPQLRLGGRYVIQTYFTLHSLLLTFYFHLLLNRNRARCLGLRWNLRRPH